MDRDQDTTPSIGSIDDVMGSMSGVDLAADSEMPSLQDVVQSREPNGRFQPPSRREEEPAQKAQPTAREAKPGDNGGPDLDDWIELPSEEAGAEPQRLKLDDVLTGYNRAQTLEREIADMRKSGPMPEHYEQELIGVVQERQKWLDATDQWLAFNQVREPNAELLNPQSQNYDPDAFYRQHRNFEALKADRARVEAERRSVVDKQQEQQKTLARAHMSREHGKLLEFWPEFKEKSVRDQFAKDIQRHFGVDQNTLNGIADARFYKVAKSALAYERIAETLNGALKSVRAKPKLVRGTARQNTNTQTARFQQGFDRLQKSGSLEDGAAALAGLDLG
jgi:hypothetical protein